MFSSQISTISSMSMSSFSNDTNHSALKLGQTTPKLQQNNANYQSMEWNSENMKLEQNKIAVTTVAKKGLN